VSSREPAYVGLATPHVLIDGSRTRLNIEKMAALVERNGVALRPHVKTHKIPAIARAQVEAGAVWASRWRRFRKRRLWPTPDSRISLSLIRS
jgi:D-serine deaminase-like pyridoxal phosphate-dependent protein